MSENMAMFRRMKEPICHKGLLFPAYMHRGSLEQLETWQMRPDDILVDGWTRSGNHLCKYILWYVMNNGAPLEDDIFDLIPYVDVSKEVKDGADPFDDQVTNPLIEIDNMDKSKPRMVCSHIPYRLMPYDVKQGKVKVILQLRNIKDATNSNYFLWKDSGMFIDSSYTLDEWIHEQLKGEVPYGSWIEHTKEWWSHRDEIPLLIMQYEDMLDIAKFVDVTLTPDIVSDIAKRVTFSTMKKKPDLFDSVKHLFSTPYLRKGVYGDWKNNFTVAQSDKIDKALQERMKDVDIKFKYE
ncbi:unnamed protein product [Owenia fusiformis]|uniref:Sulfotransferase domain-containing protein n=1 Tax=Owenia fusiformis TaxID=6347 RepID=A0A8S4Q7U9_OWEFU|nr:unnamed protein product [Owenia fusiformis]